VRRVKLVLMLATVGVTMLLATAVPAAAATIRCGGGSCFETPFNDFIIGGRAADDIFAQPFGGDRDRVESKQGRDFINVRDGNRRDRVDCGKGRDVVRANRHDNIANNCERVRYS
jgi:hypothetical protein